MRTERGAFSTPLQASGRGFLTGDVSLGGLRRLCLWAVNTKPAAIQAFNCQLPRACSGLGPGLGAGDPDSHSVLALQGLTVQGRKGRFSKVFLEDTPPELSLKG